jgi:hypothetical protein
MKKSNIYFISILFTLVLTPMILAAWNTGSWGMGYYNSPLYLFENEWVMFGIYFIVFFAVIFYTVNRSFKDSKIAGVIAFGLSSLISVTLAQRGWLYNYMGGEIGSWILVVTVLIAFGFLLKFSYESFGRIGAIASVIIIWALMHGSDPYEVLPYNIINNGPIIGIYEFVASWVGLIFLIIISAIIITARLQRIPKNMRYTSDMFFGR